MGLGGSRALSDTNFGKNLCASIQTSQRCDEFCDLIILSARDHSSTKSTDFQNKGILPTTLPEFDGLLQEKNGLETVFRHSYCAHKVVVSVAFPKLSELFQAYYCFDTIFSDKVIQNLRTYAYFGKLVLDDHLLGVIGALLELLPAEELRKLISAEVRAHVNLLLTDRNVVDTMSTPEMAALVFVAKIHDLDVIELLFDWKVRRATLDNDLDGIYIQFMTYLLNSGKGAPLSAYEVPDGERNLGL